MSKPVSDELFDVWHTYRKVVGADYMYHVEIGAEVNRVLCAQFEGRPIAVLDLGCGDAATLAPLLKGMAPARYKGVDLSETALALAAENLKPLPCPVELSKQDIMAALSEDATAYDVIYTSFVLHHLSTEMKAEFFRRAARRLEPHGSLILVDVMRAEDESLDVYHARYCGWLRGNWSALDAKEMDAVCDHLVNNDLPEPYAVLQAQAQAAGLGKVLPVSCYGWHRAICFMRG